MAALKSEENFFTFDFLYSLSNTKNKIQDAMKNLEKTTQ
jgi:hypothetical protein